MMELLLTIAFLLLSYLVVFYAYRSLIKKKSVIGVANNDSCEILKEIKSNNTFLPMLDVFTCLNEELSKCGAELHADLRGYLDHGKAE